MKDFSMNASKPLPEHIQVLRSALNEGDFYIVNSFDRPYERLVTQLRDGKLYYIHAELRDVKHYKGMDAGGATRVANFGIVLRQTTEGLHGSLEFPTTAKYRNGDPRQWQGQKQWFIDFPQTEEQIKI